jgi:hypothetical protein
MQSLFRGSAAVSFDSSENLPFGAPPKTSQPEPEELTDPTAFKRATSPGDGEAPLTRINRPHDGGAPVGDQRRSNRSKAHNFQKNTGIF